MIKDARLSGRGLKTRVRTAKGRKTSSTLWLARQLNDPYVAEAKRLGYPSRSAFKLIEIDDKFHILKPGMRVVDLGAAPGGWSHVAAARIKADKGKGCLIALDIQEMSSIPGVRILRRDALDEDTPEIIRDALEGTADVVLSDMAPSSTGHGGTDHIRIMALVEATFDIACQLLPEGGALIAKTMRGGTEGELLKKMKQRFRSVKHAKPPASRSGSREMYLVAQGFRPGPE